MNKKIVKTRCLEMQAPVHEKIKNFMNKPLVGIFHACSLGGALIGFILNSNWIHSLCFNFIFGNLIFLSMVGISWLTDGFSGNYWKIIQYIEEKE